MIGWLSKRVCCLLTIWKMLRSFLLSSRHIWVAEISKYIAARNNRRGCKIVLLIYLKILSLMKFIGRRSVLWSWLYIRLLLIRLEQSLKLTWHSVKHIRTTLIPRDSRIHVLSLISFVNILNLGRSWKIWWCVLWVTREHIWLRVLIWLGLRIMMLMMLLIMMLVLKWIRWQLARWRDRFRSRIVRVMSLRTWSWNRRWLIYWCWGRLINWLRRRWRALLVLRLILWNYLRSMLRLFWSWWLIWLNLPDTRSQRKPSNAKSSFFILLFE